jgi:ADP-ribose pyrophosphatase YjhB (NUDIX family)
MPRATAAAIVLSVDGARILLTKRACQPFKGDWCIPGGHIEDNEYARDAAVREVKEETNLDFEPAFFAYFDEVFPERKVHNVVLVFVGIGTGEPAYPPAEVSEAGWFSLEQALELPLAFAHGDVLRAFARQRSKRG